MNLFSEDCIKVGNDLYMIARALNIAYTVNVQTGNLKVIDALHDTSAQTPRSGACILLHSRSIYFLPMNARVINAYNLKSGEWKTIEIDHIDGCYGDRFFGGIVHNDTLHMIGHTYPAIVTLDLKSLKVNIANTEIYSRMKDEKDKNKIGDCYIRKDFAIVGEKLYAASCVSNHVLIYDLNSKKAELVNVGKKGMRFSGIAYDGKNFWLASRMTMEFYKWDIVTGKIDAFEIDKTSKEDFYLSGVVYDGLNVIFTGMNSSYSYIINPFADNTMQSLDQIDRSFTFVRNYGDIDYCMTPQGYIELRSVGDFKTIVKKIDVNINDSVAINFVNKKGEVFQETQTVSLSEFINGITQEI